jgi:hypothetical protein
MSKKSNEDALNTGSNRRRPRESCWHPIVRIAQPRFWHLETRELAGPLLSINVAKDGPKQIIAGTNDKAQHSTPNTRCCLDWDFWVSPHVAHIESLPGGVPDWSASVQTEVMCKRLIDIHLAAVAPAS